MATIISIIISVIMGWLQPWLPTHEVAISSSTNSEIAALNCDISARSGVAVLNQEVELCSHEPDQVMPIASISKLMTVLVFLDHNPGWETVYRIKNSDRREGGRIYLFSGDEVTVKDLFYSALIASDNTAVISLVNVSGMSETEFTQAMNDKARSLGLTKTYFSEPTGLSNLNVSTAREVARFAAEALANEEVTQAVLNSQYSFKTKQGRLKVIYSTGQPLASQAPGLEFLGGKTGYLSDSGYCFVGLFAKDDQRIITVVLGAADSEDRFNQTALMLEAYNSANQLN
ncbi:MAG: serine hydrolase [bacterium]